VDTNTIYQNLPEGYIEKRKKATLIATGTVYLFCMFQLLKEFGVINVYKGSVLSLIQYAIVGLSIIAIMNSYTVKRFYNNIPMLNCNEVKVFSKKQCFLLIVPIVIVIPYILVPFIFYCLAIVMSYAAFGSFNKSNSTNANIRSKW
jgi:hypothetical protein